MSEVPQIVVDILVPIALALGTAVLGLLGTWLNKARLQVKSKALQNILDVVGGVALNAVSDVMANSVQAIKIASSDGKLTPAEAQGAFHKAVNIAWLNLTKDVRAFLTKEAGSEEAAKNRFVAPSINAAVFKAKTAFAPTLDKPRTEVTAAKLQRAREYLGHR